MQEASAPGGAAWRQMREDDLHAVGAIAARVHPDYPDKGTALAERSCLYPAGCHVLDFAGQAAGYAISHAWAAVRPPRLNSLLGAPPADALTLYLHDLALLPTARGVGAASRVLRHLTELARAVGLLGLSLLAVNGSGAFWERRGFRAVQDRILEQKLRSYDLATLLTAWSLP